MNAISYKSLDDCIPDGEDFQNWVQKTHLKIHPELVRKLTEPENEEEDDEIQAHCYILKTFDKDGEYKGLFELDNIKCWTTETEAREAFAIAIEFEEMGSVELIRVDPNANEDRVIIDEWENLWKDLFSEDEDEDDEEEEEEPVKYKCFTCYKECLMREMFYKNCGYYCSIVCRD